MRYRTFTIAEAGVNHNGSLGMAKELVNRAAEAGADAVKFQTFQPERVISRRAEKAEYQLRATDAKESQLEMIRKLQIDFPAHVSLANHCSEKGIIFLSTPFDAPSIDLLVALGIKIMKIPSGEVTNLPYLRKIGALGKEIILSTGMSTLEEVRTALNVLVSSGTPRERITILHCNTEYPTPYEDVNLLAMKTMAEDLRVQVGYSDHTLGIETSIAAVALGARVIEKHFTLDRTLPGPDHKASIEPYELIALIQGIRNIEKALGDGIKKPSLSELKNIPVIRRSIVAARDIVKGEVLGEDNLDLKRPGTGISPMLWDEVVGQKAPRDFAADEEITL